MILPVFDFKIALLSFLSQLEFPGKQNNFLISFGFKVEGIKFNSYIDSAIKESNKVFYLCRPEEKLELLALDSAFSLNVEGNNSFTSLKNLVSGITDNRVHNLNDGLLGKLPLAFGGTKFCSGNKKDEWSDFADNDWFVPALLFYSKNGEQYIIANIYADENKFPFNKTGRIIGLLEWLTPKSELEKPVIPIININYPDGEEEKWNTLVNDTLAKIYKGKFGKVVLSRRVTASVNESPSFRQMMINLQTNYNNCTTFLFKSGVSVLFGSTPEQLLRFRNNQLEFDALAGSAKRGVDDEEDKEIASLLLMDKKNMGEHNHVIEFIRKTVSGYVSNLNQFETGIKKFSNIQHIYTPIKAELISTDKLFNLVEDLFPTPAVCGYPKEESFQYIIGHEDFNRGMFSGIVGYMNLEEMDLVIAIRSALLQNKVLYLYAGCGIVPGSDPKSEFEETKIKMKPILSLFINENK